MRADHFDLQTPGHPSSDSVLRGNRSPCPHRFYLVDGRVIEGGMYRQPESRLSDDLYGMKGDFLGVVDARNLKTDEEVPFMVINKYHIVSVEEV